MADGQDRVVCLGDKVRVNYVGRFADGTIFDSSEGHAPLEFMVGAGQVIPGFDQAVLGLKPGETKVIDVAPEQGYGRHLAEMVAEVERRQVPEDHRLVVGGFLEVCMQDGKSLEVQVVALTETSVTLDANHPLAGRALNFEIELLEFV